MLVADNRAYDYSKTPYLEQMPLEQPKAKPAPKYKKKPKTKLHIIKILLVFSLSILIVARYGYIAELNFQSRSLNAGIKEASMERTDLKVELSKTVNLEYLEKTAKEKLGMEYPNIQTQIIYVSVDSTYPAESEQDKSYLSAVEVKENKYIKYTKDAFENILKVLQ